MLRASSEKHEQSVELDAVMNGGNSGDIPWGPQLTQFAETVVKPDEQLRTDAREALVRVAGEQVMIDAAGIASNFQRMVRIADSTGIVLGDFEQPTAAMRAELGIDAFKDQPDA